MKKFTLVAAMAALALGASAQYSVTPGIGEFVKNVPAEGYTVDAIVLSETGQNLLKDANCTVNTALLPNETTSFFYIWDGQTTGGDSTYPDADFSGEGYLSLVVGGAGWSGGGYFVNNEGGFSTKNFTDETTLHFEARTTNDLASLGLLILQGDVEGSAAGCISVGSEAFNDNGNIYPLVGSMSEEWAAYEVSLGELKKLAPSFNLVKCDGWYGNSLAMLAGGVQGKEFSLANVFFYTPNTAGGVEGIAADNEAPVVYYNLQGVQVENPANGLFIKKQGNKAEKVLVK